MTPRLFDTHFHLDLVPDPRATVRQIESDGIPTIAVTNAPSVYESTARLSAGCRHIRPALGLHPELAAERHRELDLFARHLPSTRYVGEVGLDYVTQDASVRRTQRRVFEEIVSQCDAAGDKVLTVHSRRAEADVVATFGDQFQGAVILHWYSGSLRTLGKATERGFYISVNPAMARGKRFSHILDRVPRDRVLLETDGPFVSVGKRPALPHDTSCVVDRISQLWGVPMEEALARLFANFWRILRAGSSGAPHHSVPTPTCDSGFP